MLSLDHLRTFFTASFIALAIVACGGSSSDATPSGTNGSGDDIVLDTPDTPDEIEGGAENDDLDDNAQYTEEILEETSFSSPEIEVLMITLMERIAGNAHGNHKPVSKVPSSGELMIDVVFSKRPSYVNFSIIDINGIEISEVVPDDTANTYNRLNYLGYFNVPVDDFKIRIKGVEDNESFFHDLPKIYSPGP